MKTFKIGDKVRVIAENDFFADLCGVVKKVLISEKGTLHFVAFDDLDDAMTAFLTGDLGYLKSGVGPATSE